MSATKTIDRLKNLSDSTLAALDAVIAKARANGASDDEIVATIRKATATEYGADAADAVLHKLIDIERQRNGTPLEKALARGGDFLGAVISSKASDSGLTVGTHGAAHMLNNLPTPTKKSKTRQTAEDARDQQIIENIHSIRARGKLGRS